LTPIDESKLRKLLNHLVAKHPEIIETIDKFLVPATPVNKAAEVLKTFRSPRLSAPPLSRGAGGIKPKIYF